MWYYILKYEKIQRLSLVGRGTMNYEKTRIIPTIESGIFENNDEAMFAIAEVSPEDLANMKEFSGAAKLRANTYLESGFVSEEELDADGTELDDNDERSVHYMLFERTAIQSLVRVVGNMRLVRKTELHPEPLPVEGYFPDYFADEAPIGSVEVSRLIARHENTGLQSLLKWPMFIAAHQRVVADASGPAYGLLEPALAHQLAIQNVPVTALEEARYIEEINATKQPVEIDVAKLGRFIQATGSQGVDITNSVSYLNLSNESGERRSA